MRARTTALVVALGAALANGGCGEDATTSPDLSVGSSDQGANLALTAGGTSRPLAAVYSFYVEPLADNPAEEGVYLVVTAVDPAFDCAHPTGGLDALAFIFQAARGAGATTTTILSARGPDLDAATGGSGAVTLSADDDRLSGYDLDGGTVAAGAGGSVAGTMHYAASGVTVDGSFTAARCAALDFIVPG